MTPGRDHSGVKRALQRAQAPELALAVRGTVCGAIAGLPVVALATVLRGRPGLLGATLGAGLVIGLFAMTGVLLACVVRRSPATLPAVSLVGALIRMIAYGALLTALAGVDDIDRASLVLATCLLLIVTMVYEVRFVTTTPGFYWLHAAAPDGARAKERTQG
jgi:hypothetical protein